ncbi:uncharacterized protein DS421_12g368700 [Arachis hypogaea]|nr:uncharacterized protein DS421_12g368700 [Arachis hypogaea]
MFKAVSQDLLVPLRPLLNQSDLRDSRSRCCCHSRSRSHKHRRRRSHHRRRRYRHAVIRTMKELDLRGGEAKKMLLMSQLILASLRNQVQVTLKNLLDLDLGLGSILKKMKVVLNLGLYVSGVEYLMWLISIKMVLAILKVTC